MSGLLLEVTRGPLVEEIHRGNLAVVDVSGKLLASIGDPIGAPTYWRSAAKPFQAMPLVATGGAAKFGLGPAEIAITCASHSGEPMHTERASTVLDRAGNAIADLACGTHPPLYPPAAAALRESREELTAIHNNCSGKHSGMLALAKQLGVPADGYREPGHPVQELILENIARFTDLKPEEIAIGVDGCGVPCYGLSVQHMALAYARLMKPDGIDEPYRSAAGTVRDAMMAHPELVGGTTRLDTDLMRLAPRLLVKGGASGVLCIGIAGGIGLAAKLEAGPRMPGFLGSVLIEALRQVGELTEAQVTTLAVHARPQVTNVSGAVVGETRPAFTLFFKN